MAKQQFECEATIDIKTKDFLSCKIEATVHPFQTKRQIKVKLKVLLEVE